MQLRAARQWVQPYILVPFAFIDGTQAKASFEKESKRTFRCLFQLRNRQSNVGCAWIKRQPCFRHVPVIVGELDRLSAAFGYASLSDTCECRVQDTDPFIS